MEFKLIRETNNRYKVNVLGQVRSVKSQKVIKSFIISDYLCALLRPLKGERQYKTFKIHRLIAIYFIPNLLNKETVNHKDGNKLNNNIDNLEWNTRSENELHSFRVLGKKSNNPFLGKFNSENPTSKPVKQILNDKIIKIWPSVSEAGRNGFNIAHISMVCNGKEKSHKGFYWEY